MSEKKKGAFKEYPVGQQPDRIPLNRFHILAAKVEGLLASYGETHVPDATKKSKGRTTGDLDVMFIPHKSEGWQETVRNVIPNIVVWKTNGPQLMMVVKGLIDDNQYMIDVLLSNREEWSYRRFYHGFGVVLPAVIGSFARSLGYKFGQDGLYRRQRDIKNNYHNLKLTNSPPIALAILGLDPSVADGDDLFDPIKVADWIISSSRFDSDVWRNPPSDDGITIVVKNNKSHRAARQKAEVIDAYNRIDVSKKKSEVVNNNFEIERSMLGDAFIDDLLDQLNQSEKKASPVLTGDEVMEIMKITPGPEVGHWIKFANDLPEVQGLEPVEAKKIAVKILRSRINTS